MRDYRRSAGVGHCADTIEAFLVTGGDPLVLAQMFLPGRNDELLDEAVGLGTVAPHAPGACARSPAAEARVVEC